MLVGRCDIAFIVTCSFLGKKHVHVAIVVKKNILSSIMLDDVKKTWIIVFDDEVRKRKKSVIDCR